MKKLFMIALLSISCVFADEFKYQIDITKDGKFEITNSFSFKSDIDLKTVLDDYYLDIDFQKMIDPMAYDMELKNEKRSKFRMYTTAQMLVKNTIPVRNTLVFDCNRNVTDTNMSLSCILDTSRRGEDSRKRFEYSSYSFSCEKLSDDISCEFNLSGQTKNINLWIYKRSEERLAMSGSQHYLTNLYKTFHALSLNSKKRMSELRHDTFFQNDIQKVRVNLFKSLNSKDIMLEDSTSIEGNL